MLVIDMEGNTLDETLKTVKKLVRRNSMDIDIEKLWKSGNNKIILEARRDDE